MRYANRAKQIKNKPKVNEDPKDALIKEYQDKIKEMSKLLDDPNALRKKLKQLNPNDTDDQLQDKLEKYEQQFSSLNNALLDKDKFINDINSDKNKLYYQSQIEINLLKKQREQEIKEAEEKNANIQNK